MLYKNNKQASRDMKLFITNIKASRLESVQDFLIKLDIKPLHRGAFCQSISGGFTTMAVINPPKKKLAKHISVHCAMFIQ